MIPPSVQRYIDHLGQRIAAEVPGAKIPFTFSVIADDLCRVTHEPAALPGGYVFVPAALFLAAQDEAEFAGMLAHAMEQIAQRHVTRQATRGTIVNYASIPLIHMGGWAGTCSERHTMPLAFLQSQRNAELEADSLAVQTMARAGFDPKGLLRYIQRVQLRLDAGGPLTSYSTLPDRDYRLAAMSSAIDKLPAAAYTASALGDFAAAQQEVRRLAERARSTPPSLMRKRPQ